jgi:hypothetical protein
MDSRRLAVAAPTTSMKSAPTPVETTAAEAAAMKSAAEAALAA